MPISREPAGLLAVHIHTRRAMDIVMDRASGECEGARVG